MATTCPAVTRTVAWTQAKKRASKAAGSSAAKTRPKVSWEGMPLGRSRNWRRKVSLRRPNVSTATQVPAPAITAQMAIVTTSNS